MQTEMIKAQEDRINEEVERLVKSDPRNAARRDEIRKDLINMLNEATQCDEEEQDTLQQKVKHLGSIFAQLNQIKVKNIATQQ